MDRLPNEVLGMILDELKPSSLFIWTDMFNSDGRRTIRDIKSMRLCSRKFAEVAAKHLFQEIWLCLHSRSFTKASSIMNHRLYSGMVRELQVFPVFPALFGYMRGFSFMDDGLDTFYEEQAEPFLLTKDQRRKSNIERFMDSVFASFEKLSAVRFGDSAAFTPPRSYCPCQPRYFCNGIFTPTDGYAMFRSVKRARSKFKELQLCMIVSSLTGNLSFDGLKHLRLNPFVGNRSARFLALCPNLESLCITGNSVHDREYCFYDRLGNDLCDIYWPHLKAFSLSHLTVGADEVAEFLRRHKLTLVEVSLSRLAFLTGSLFQLFSDLREMKPCPAVDVADLVVIPGFHLFPAENALQQELLDKFLHTDPSDFHELDPNQSRRLTAESILKASHPKLRPKLEKELKAYLYRRRHGYLLTNRAQAQLNPLTNLLKSWERVDQYGSVHGDAEYDPADSDDMYKDSDNFGDDDGDLVL